MRYVRVFAAVCMCAVLCLQCAALGAEYTIDDFGIENISVDDKYMICTQDSCDDNFKNLLSGNGFTFDRWCNEIMKPNNYYIYAMDKNSNCFYVVCEKGEIQETVTNKDGSKTHKLMADYNMIADGEEKEKFISTTKQELIGQGVSQSSITQLTWAKTDDEVTSYIEYVCVFNDQYLHCYDTIYNGNTINFQFVSQKNFSKSQLEEHKEIINNIKYKEIVDYTEAEEIVKENIQQKLKEETHSGENTRIVRYSISISIGLVIVFAVFMAIRTQSKKRRKTVVLREVEVQDTPDENDDQ